MSNIKIENPWLLFVGLGLILASVGAFFLIPKAKRIRPKNLISLGLHIVISITLALAFANIKFVTTSSDVEVYAVVDVSDSESQNADKLTELVQDLYKQAGSKNAKVGVVAYGKNQTTLAKAGSRISSDAIKKLFEENNSTIDRSATDIASALTYTNNLFSDNVVRRMVLISDGIETDGSAIDTIETLKNNDVMLDCIDVSDSLKHEVAITGIEYTDRVFKGRTETVTISVRATRSTNGKIKITCGGNTIADSDVRVSIAKGLNVVTYTLPTSEAGRFDYEVTLEADSDTFEENNIKRFTQTVTEDYKFLYLSGNERNEETNILNSLGIYNDSSKVTYSFEYVNVPYKMEELVKYDEIILSDFNVTKLDEELDLEREDSIASQFVNNIKACVSVYGKSLLTFGDTHTGLSNEEYSYLSDYGDMLPVQSHSEGGKAVIFLIDVSGSMDTDNRLTMAKKGAIAALDTFSDEDMVGITTFSDETKIVKPLTSIRNKEELARAINKMKTEGGTTMGPALKMCGKELNDSTAEFKTVITLSDGDPFDTDASLNKIVRQLAEDNITCSFINISNRDSASVSRLKRLATYGNGNYYFVSKAQQLVDVMVNSVSEEITNIAIKQDDTTVVVRTANDEVLNGTNNTFASLSGFNYCRIKPQAETVLTATYIRNEETLDDNGNSNSTTTTYNVPLYAHWTYGKGTVSSFTADLIDDTTASFRNTPGGAQFFRNLVTTTLPTRSANNLLDFSYVNYGYTTTVNVNPNNGDYTGKIVIKVKDPDNATTEYELIYNGSSYSVSVPVSKTGIYDVEINYYESNDGNISSEITATDTQPLYFDYSKEYNFFDTDMSSDILYRLASNLSGNTTSDRVDYNTSDAEYQYSSYFSTMMIFLLISVGLFLVDIFVRKSDIIFRKKKASENAAINQ